ncbi:amino acid ABC transporter substrate-binding protein [Corticimicrobacter populi]|uniref:Amino acid ABC transporter substrate-binding protein n=1 Tax=Corticimicrobacter populi TaxID=2175229 RepID=A0A2V1K093_9BURK|nr:amino acid ABC transporter substrate-binding protein [Corticimicrobacter populi]PWF22540.1 amino acid ABC transporter substrate-binding protein [Corticimicrobacter populi]QDQ86447.1 amino acid ABC transporter substrate-binding protein [Alcaligenaceae bacterium SJ-26]
MKKILMSAIVAGSALASLSAAHADTLGKIADSGQITLAYRESSVPFSYLVGPSEPVGFSVEIAKAVAEEVKKQLGKPDLKVNWQPVTSQNRIPLLANGTIDLECGSTTNNSTRAQDVAFATNHFYTGTRLLTKKSSGIQNYEDLKGKNIATTTGTTNFQVLRRYDREHNLGMNILPGKDHADSFLLVETGRALAFGMDDILLFGLIANSKDPSAYEVVGEALQVEPYACMLRKDDPKFKELVDGVINGMMDSGQFATLYDTWFMQPIPPSNVPLGLPMSEELKKNITEHSDKPAT